MADYIYLLENRLSKEQKNALSTMRLVARERGITLFLVGGAVRDLTSGSPVRDLDVAIQGNALKLKKDVEAAGGVISGTWEAGQALYVRFAGSVRMEIGSTLAVTYPKPGKPVMKGATILEDLRRRDFTANAMALSLNEGSYGLLMDPLNGVADIENRELRLVSNYGFIEDPVRMVRAIRFAARLGWALEEKTKARYETGKEEGYIKALDDFRRGYEAEEIVHEEDPLRVMRRLEAEGWLEVLAPGWTTAKANTTDLEKVREAQTQIQMQGIHPDASAINFPLLTAKLGAKEVQALKKSFPRQGFVAEIDGLEADAREFAAVLGSRATSTPSTAYRTILSAKPESLLFVSFTTKSAALQAKLKSFMTEWPQARQKIPYALMQEMRITPELEGYAELVEKLFFELMDGRLGTVEEMKAFLEPHSPPAPPPPVHVRRSRAAKKSAKGKGKKSAGLEADEDDDLDASDTDSEGLDEMPTGAEEDEEAEEAAENFDAVAELGGSSLGRKGRDDEEEDGMEEEAPEAERRPTKLKIPREEERVVAASPAIEAAVPQPEATRTAASKPAASPKAAARVSASASAPQNAKQTSRARPTAGPGKTAKQPATPPAKIAGVKAPAKQVVVAVPAKVVAQKAAAVKAAAVNPSAAKAESVKASATRSATGKVAGKAAVAKTPMKSAAAPANDAKVPAKKVAGKGR